MAETKSDKNEQFLRVEEVARILRISSRTVYRWLYGRKIQAKKLGRSWYISRKVVSDLVDGAMGTDDATSNESSFFLGQAEHLLALAPEQKAVAGFMARLAEMGLQHDYRVFAGCWQFTPDELRSLMRTLGIPTEALELEGTVTIEDFGAIFASQGAVGILQKWRDWATVCSNDRRPLLAMGAPFLECWRENPEHLVEFEKSLNDLWRTTSALSVCIYPLKDFIPDSLRRVGTLIGIHTGILLWSETKLMLLRPDEISRMFTISDSVNH